MSGRNLARIRHQGLVVGQFLPRVARKLSRASSSIKSLDGSLQSIPDKIKGKEIGSRISIFMPKIVVLGPSATHSLEKAWAVHAQHAGGGRKTPEYSGPLSRHSHPTTVPGLPSPPKSSSAVSCSACCRRFSQSPLLWAMGLACASASEKREQAPTLLQARSGRAERVAAPSPAGPARQGDNSSLPALSSGPRPLLKVRKRRFCHFLRCCATADFPRIREGFRAFAHCRLWLALL